VKRGLRLWSPDFRLISDQSLIWTHYKPGFSCSDYTLVSDGVLRLTLVSAKYNVTHSQEYHNTFNLSIHYLGNGWHLFTSSVPVSCTSLYLWYYTRLLHPFNIKFNIKCWYLTSVLWRCWLGGRKGIWPVKKLEWWGAGVVICLERGADLHMALLMPLLLTVSCFSKIQIGFTFLVLAHPDSARKRAVKRV